MSRAGSRRKAARRLLRRVHAYTGLVLSLVFLVFAVTGGALVYKEAYWRLVYPELRGPVPELGAGDHASAIAAAQGHFGASLRSVKMPEPGVGAYHLYLDDGEAFLSAVDHDVIDRWRPSERFMSFLFDLHAHLLAGETGERVAGVLGLLGAVLGVTGLVLWWPVRRRFALVHLIPRDLSRRSLLRWHQDLGAVTSPILLVLLLTGSGLVFYSAAQSLLNGVFGDPVPTAPAPNPQVGPSLSLPDAVMLSRVEAVFPGARVVFYYPPRDGVSVHRFRLKQPCELHPNGRSYVYLDATGEVIAVTDACAMPPGERTAHAIYPVHAGKTGSSIYKLAVFFGAVALAILSVSGAMTYIRKLRRVAAQGGAARVTR